MEQKPTDDESTKWADENTEWDFDGWEWGDLEDMDLAHQFWRKVSENGAAVALNEILEDEAFIIMRETDGDIELSIMIGPFHIKMKKSDMESMEEDGEPNALCAFTKATMVHWRKKKAKE